MTSGAIGAADADIMVSLKEDHKPTADFVRQLRLSLPKDFPQATFYFLPCRYNVADPELWTASAN